MFKKSLAFLMSLMLVFMPACTTLSPQQKAAVQQSLDAEHAAGTITDSQHQAASEALAKDQPFDWESLGFVAANIALALIGGPMIVRMQRGQPTQKVGLPATMVKTAPPA